MNPFNAKYYFQDDVCTKEQTFDLRLFRSKDREVIRDKQMAYAPNKLPENMSIERARVATIMMQHELFKRILEDDLEGVQHILHAYETYCRQLVDDRTRCFYNAVASDLANKETGEHADYWLQYSLARDYGKPQHSSNHLTTVVVDGKAWHITVAMSVSKPFTGNCVISASSGLIPRPTEDTTAIRHVGVEHTFAVDHFYLLNEQAIINVIKEAVK